MEFKPLEGRKFPRFSAVKTFFRLPVAPTDEKFDVALFGVPFDGGTTFRSGQRFAPAGVRDTSSLGRGYHWSRDIDFTEKLKVADVGDVTCIPLSMERTFENITGFVHDLAKSKKRFIACGGDHSITLPILRGLNKVHKKPIGLIHFDAHFDTYPAAWDCDVHHGTFVRHAVEESLIDPALTVQIGIRGPHASRKDPDFVKKHGIKVWDIDTIRQKGASAFSSLWPQFGSTPVYLSFDVDCLDPSCAPGTGTPVIGGLTTYEVQTILRGMPSGMHLVGADVVEVLPQLDFSQITQLAAVDVMFEILSHMAST